jgi:hypothetical protein
MCESCTSDGNEVILCNPSIPVLLKHAERGLIVLQLAERVFINNCIVVRTIEDTWCYPRLENEPAPSCDVKI